MLVSEIMTPHAECTQPTATIRKAAQRMKRLNVGSLPVCDKDRLVGIITDRDIVLRAIAEGMDPENTRVENAMTLGIEYCFDDQDVSEAAQIMEDRQIRRLVVLNRNKRLVGMLALGDLAVRVHDDALCGAALEQISETLPA
jgi:CBS domain-containing protein